MPRASNRLRYSLTILSAPSVSRPTFTVYYIDSKNNFVGNNNASFCMITVFVQARLILKLPAENYNINTQKKNKTNDWFFARLASKSLSICLRNTRVFVQTTNKHLENYSPKSSASSLHSPVPRTRVADSMKSRLVRNCMADTLTHII